MSMHSRPKRNIIILRGHFTLEEFCPSYFNQNNYFNTALKILVMRFTVLIYITISDKMNGFFITATLSVLMISDAISFAALKKHSVHYYIFAPILDGFMDG